MKQRKVIIAGGGIGGLAAALALLRADVAVELYEQADALREIGAGIQMSANAMRVFAALGIAERIEAAGSQPTHREMRLWNSGQAWRSFDLGAVSRAEYGQPYVTLYRPDLMAVLEAAVREADPFCIRLGARAVGCSQDGQAHLHLADGRIVSGDALIGADGIRSVVREALHGADAAEFTGMTAWRGVIPAEALPLHLRQAHSSNWVGPGGHVVYYPLRGGRLMNMVGVLERADWTEEGWNIPGMHAAMHQDFAGWHADIHAMIDAIPQPYLWALKLRRPLPFWGQGRVTLLGDACHPTLPFLAQGAVMAIEDAMVLARALSAQPVEEALRRYEAARYGRTSLVIERSWAMGQRYHDPRLSTPEGAAAAASEMTLERMRERFDWLYRYDATSVPLE